jgi:catechol 2,3-dioxygenase-like lactoylglutathione lyase family enzyme
MSDPVAPNGLRFHHLGLAVRRPRDALRFLSGLGYAVNEWVYDPEQNVNLIFCKHTESMPDVEIIYPGVGKSPVDGLVTQRPDGIVYHMCYVTADLAATLDWMEANGVRAICKASPTPAVLFGGRLVSFYDIVGMGLCEIIEDPAPPAA